LHGILNFAPCTMGNVYGILNFALCTMGKCVIKL
jgi:hypothetical protein